jgi:PRTRC genetic system protein C
MGRIFVYDGREFPDPDPTMSVDEVRSSWAHSIPELANASVKETKQGDDTVHTFERRTGTKGAL